MDQLNAKLNSRIADKFIAGGYQLILRKCVIEGFRGLVTCFRDEKWREIQGCVNGIIANLTSTEEQQSDSSDDDDENEIEEFNFTLESFSLEFCESHRSC